MHNGNVRLHLNGKQITRLIFGNDPKNSRRNMKNDEKYQFANVLKSPDAPSECVSSNQYRMEEMGLRWIINLGFLRRLKEGAELEMAEWQRHRNTFSTTSSKCRFDFIRKTNNASESAWLDGA